MSSVKLRAATLFTAGMLGAGSASAAPSITTFDVPGAGTSGLTQQGTVGIQINDAGSIVGIIRDTNDVRHGYIRHPNGKSTVFDHPSAGTAPFQGTRVGGFNALGVVTGTFRDASGYDHPYVRDLNGAFTTINLPNLLGGNGWAINLWGTVVGNFLNLTDDQSVLFHYHAYLRSANGALTLFDPPGSVDTEIPTGAAINDEGVVTGDYWVCSADLSSCSVHGFLRLPNGKYLSFDVPGAGPDGFSGQGTYPQAINDLGEVTGYYADANSVYHGFVRAADGHITSFDVPTTCTGTAPPPDCAFEGTFPGSINNLGVLTGVYFGEDGAAHGFWRAANGTIGTIDVPLPGYQTYPVSINDWGQVTGIAYDPNFATHGLLVTP
jgi:hypothetical protein